MCTIVCVYTFSGVLCYDCAFYVCAWPDVYTFGVCMYAMDPTMVPPTPSPPPKFNVCMYVCMYICKTVSWSIWASRMKLRSPTLPEDLEALWDYFIDNVPDWLWRKHTRKDMGGTIISNTLGIAFLNDIKHIQRDLGEHFQPNPLNPPKKKPRITGGDAMAFTNWIHKVVQANRGRVSM